MVGNLPYHMRICPYAQIAYIPNCTLLVIGTVPYLVRVRYCTGVVLYFVVLVQCCAGVLPAVQIQVRCFRVVLLVGSNDRGAYSPAARMLRSLPCLVLIARIYGQNAYGSLGVKMYLLRPPKSE